MVGARLIAGKLGEKLKRSKAVLLSQHIGMAMLGLQRLGPETVEVRYTYSFYFTERKSKSKTISNNNHSLTIDLVKAYVSPLL
jgi:hypothetical protein